MSADRKSVLLRLDPTLLVRIDRQVTRSGLSRTEWVVDVLHRYLTAIAEPREATEARFAHVLKTPNAEAAKKILDEDGTDLGLVATPREDGALEISLATDTHTEKGSGNQCDDAPAGEAEEPDRASHLTSTSRAEQGLCGDLGCPREYGESDMGSESDDGAERLSAGSPPLSWTERSPSREKMGLPPLEPYDPYEF